MSYIKHEWRWALFGFGLIVFLVGSSPVFLAASDNAPPAAAKLPLSAALVLTPEFCKTILQVEGTGLNAFGLGHFACKDLELALQSFFSSLAVVQSMPAPGAAQVVLQPSLVGPDWKAGRIFVTSRKSPTISFEWTVKDGSGNVVWTGTVQASVKREIGRNPISGYHTLQDIVKDVAEQSGPQISSAPEVRKFAQLLLAKSGIANTSVQVVAASDQTQAVMDANLQVSATLVLTPGFCETRWGVEDRLPLELGQRVCQDVESSLKGFFSSVTVVQDTPAPGVAQIVLQPRFPDVNERTKTMFSGTRKHATVWLEWKVTDASGNVVWIGKVQGEVKHPIGSLVGVWPRAVQEAAKDLAEQSGLKISSAPEVRNFARLLLAKSSVANSPATAAAAGELFQAVRDSDSAKIMALLKDNPGLASAVNGDADAPLHVAASLGQKEAAELLLASHADVNAKDANGATPLQDAAYAGHKDVAELLLANKANVGAADFKGATALHKAADQDHADLAELLLRHNADVRARDSGGQTPLLFAASAGHKDVVKLLLANKAEVNFKNDKDTTPLYAAILNRHTDVARLLLASGADVNVKTKSGSTPLHLAANSGPKDLVELLLASKGDVNAKEAGGATPLLLAAVAGNKDVMELLLAKNAEVNARGIVRNSLCTALHVAALSGSKEMVELLIANKADVNARNSLGETPLHLAAIQGHKDVAEVLLAHNAEVNAQRGEGATPLHNAVIQDHPDVAELLRQRGGQDFGTFRWPEAELIGPPHKVVLLPVVSSLADTHVKVDLEKLRKTARKDLERKRYEVIEVETPPPGERWVMSFNLLDIGGRGITSSAEVSCILKDQQTGLTQWQGGASGVRQSSLTGTMSPEEVRQMGALRAGTVQSMEQTTDILLAALMPGSARQSAINNAVSDALRTIPTLPKKK